MMAHLSLVLCIEKAIAVFEKDVRYPGAVK